MLSTLTRSTARFALPHIARSRAPVLSLTAKRYFANQLNKDGPAFTYSGKGPLVKYTNDHEWIAAHEDGTAYIGITKHAADALGDATYVEVPNAGDSVEKGDSIGSVESVKAASELFSPVSGEILEGNSELLEQPNLVNDDPLGAAWFGKIKISDESELDELMDLEVYEEFLKSN